MPITSANCNSFKLELLQGIHDLRTDTIKMALYDNNAVLDKATTTYTTANEIASSGYVAGGVVMPLTAGFPTVDISDRAVVRLDPATWGPTATIAAYGALLYNSSKGNRAIAVISFGVLPFRTDNGTMNIQFPLTGEPPIILS